VILVVNSFEFAILKTILKIIKQKMLTYDDPEKKYIFKKINQGNAKTKVWMLVFLALAILFLVYLIKNDFRPDLFSSKNKFIPKCPESHDLKIYQDIRVSRGNAERVLEENFAEIESWAGFKRVEILEGADGFKGSLVPVIQIVFDQNEIKKSEKPQVKPPKEICKFSTEIVME